MARYYDPFGVEVEEANVGDGVRPWKAALQCLRLDLLVAGIVLLY
jgi:hypothetical protein